MTRIYSKYLDENLLLTSGLFNEFDLPLDHAFTKPHHELFAFDCNSKLDFKEYFLNTYKKIDPLWNSNPLITSICVANRGWFAFANDGWRYRAYDDIKGQNEETIGYLCCCVHGLENIAYSRGYPRIGQYLMNSDNYEIQYKNTPIKKLPTISRL